MALNAIRAKLNKLTEKADEMETGDYFLPPVDSVAFQVRLVWIDIAGETGKLEDELRHYHPKEIQQILDIDADAWDIPAQYNFGEPSLKRQILRAQELLHDSVGSYTTEG